MVVRTASGGLINSEWRKHQRAGTEQAVVSRPQEVSPDSKEILHHSVNRREPLELSGRREPSHLALPLTRRLVGDLGSIVRVLIRDVDHPRHHGAARGGVGAQLVGDQSSRGLSEAESRM